MGKDSSRGGKWKPSSIFKLVKLDEDGSGNYFETDQAKTDTVTLFILPNAAGCWGNPRKFIEGLIKRIEYRLNPTNAVTYIIRFWSKGGVAGDYESNAYLLYESPAAQVDDEDYDRAEKDIPMILTTPSKIWFSIDWSGAPANTTGFLKVSGEVIH